MGFDRRDFRQDTAMTKVAISYAIAQQLAIMSAACPEISTDGVESGSITGWDKDFFFARRGGIRGHADPPITGNYKVSEVDFKCKEINFASPVYDRLKKGASKPHNLDKNATIDATMQVLIEKEIRGAAVLFNTSVIPWTNSFVPTTKWDVASATPLKDIQTASDLVLKTCGVLPNRILIGAPAHGSLVQHDNVEQRSGINFSTEKNSIVDAQMAAITGRDHYHVGRLPYNSAKPGQTGSMAWIWGAHCLVYYAPENPGIDVPSACYSPMAQDIGIVRVRDNMHRATLHDCSNIIDPGLITAAGLGCLIYNVNT